MTAACTARRQLLLQAAGGDVEELSGNEPQADRIVLCQRALVIALPWASTTPIYDAVFGIFLAYDSTELV